MPGQVLRANPATVSATFLDISGTAVDSGTVTVDVTKLDGTALISGAATTSGSGVEPRTYVLTSAMTAQLDTLTVAFTSPDLSQAVEETVEVVGALLFTIAEARAWDGGVLSNTGTYPPTTIEEARARITAEFEQICGVSFVPRFRRDIVNGNGLYGLVLPRMKITAIRSIEHRTSGGATWTAYTSTELADVYAEAWGEIQREFLGVFVRGRQNIRVGYEHGFTTPPLDVKRAALMALRDELVESNISDRAISFSADGGTTQYWTPGLSGRGTAIHRIPEVDRILKLYDMKVPAIG